MTIVRTTKWLGIIFFLIPMCLISVFPLIVMISTSFKTSQEIYFPPPTFLPRNPTIQNYIDIWSVAPLATYFRNSLFIGLGSTVLPLSWAFLLPMRWRVFAFMASASTCSRCWAFRCSRTS